MASIKSWKKALRHALEEALLPDEYDTDHPNCPSCGNTMDFHGHDECGDFPLGEGYWECDGCGFKITEANLKN